LIVRLLSKFLLLTLEVIQDLLEFEVPSFVFVDREIFFLSGLKVACEGFSLVLDEAVAK